MAVPNAYSTDFIIQDLAKKYFSTPSDARKFYSKLVDSLQAGVLQIQVENEGINKLQELEEKKKDGPFDRLKFELLISLFDRGSINFNTKSGEIADCLNEITMRTTHKKKFSPAADDNVKTVFYEELPDSSIEKKIGKGLKKALIDKSKIGDGSIQFLFETSELDPIKKGEKFKWYTYLKPYGIHTNRVYIRDPYFYKNSLRNDLSSMLGPLLYASYATPIQVEIISGLNSDIRKEKAIQKVQDWLEEQDNRLDIACYYQRGDSSKLFHDRYLFTDYWALKVPAGLDVEKEGEANSYTIPTLVGRYDPNGSTWGYINENWDDWKEKKCKPIN